MSDELRKQIYDRLVLMETGDLVEIWVANDRVVWSEIAFDVMREILEQRLDELPSQGEPVFKYAIPEKAGWPIESTRIEILAMRFAWLFFIIYILWAFGNFIAGLNRLIGYNLRFVVGLNWLTINLFLDSINLFLKGIAYWLVFMSVSLGLKMIVDTDLNYRDELRSEANE